jgi:plastocyanin
MYMIDRSWTIELPDGITQDRAGIVLQIIDGADVWEVWTNYEIEYEAAYSSGLADAALTFMAAVSDIPITISVDDETYTSGEIITISGNVQAGSTTDVTVTILAPNGSIVYVSQVSPNSSGFFSDTTNITNTLDTAGIYTVRAQHDSGTVETTLYFVQTSDLPNSVTVLNAPGSSTPGCETTNSCYNPYIVTIAQGGTVTWQNSDNAAHTVTSGLPSDGPNGVFDSSLIMSGGSYSYQFNSLGSYTYFCMVHPWMIGGVLVGASAEPEPEPEPPVDLTMNIGNTEYNLNEIITVTVGLSNISEQEQVIIDVLDPEGTPVVIRAMTVSPNSSSSIDFKVSEDSLTGNYKIVASVTVDGTTVIESIYFKIKSQYNQFQIASVEVTDQQGNPSTLNRGDMAYIKVILTSDISIEPLVTVNLFDAELTTLGVGSVKTPLNQGESEIILSFLIPNDAALGDADIFVNAFTNWVSNGGIPLTPELSITEEISP